MKKILFILQKKHLESKTNNQDFNWVEDCKDIYSIDYWGKNINQDLSLQSLQNKIEQFKPDYIYLTIRKNYRKWLPDLTNINIPKIFVECDNYAYNSNDKWYGQFTKLYCRQPIWSFKYSKKFDITYFLNKKIKQPEKKYADYENYINNIKSWENIPLFRWSVPEKAFIFNKKHKKGIYFVGQWKGPYSFRRTMKKFFKGKNNIIFKQTKNKYWKLLGSASALICPTESNYGDFVPAKIFEYAASGAAILTNCDLVSYQMEDLDKVVIHYTNLKDLEKKLKMDLKKHYNKTIEIMKNHTHKIRYKELFGKL